MSVGNHKRRRAGGAFGISVVGFSTSTNDQITPHADAAVDDVALLFQRAQQDSSPTSVNPSGFTLLYEVAEQVGVGYNRVIVSYRQLASTATLTGMDGAGEDAKVLLILRATGGDIATITASTWLYENSGGSDPSDQNVAMAGQDAPIIGLGMASNRAGTAVSITGTPALDNSQYVSPGTLQMFVGYKIYNSTPADVSMNFLNPNNSSHLGSGYLRFTKT